MKYTPRSININYKPEMGKRYSEATDYSKIFTQVYLKGKFGSL